MREHSPRFVVHVIVLMQMELKRNLPTIQKSVDRRSSNNLTGDGVGSVPRGTGSRIDHFDGPGGSHSRFLKQVSPGCTCCVEWLRCGFCRARICRKFHVYGRRFFSPSPQGFGKPPVLHIARHRTEIHRRGIHRPSSLGTTSLISSLVTLGGRFHSWWTRKSSSVGIYLQVAVRLLVYC